MGKEKYVDKLYRVLSSSGAIEQGMSKDAFFNNLYNDDYVNALPEKAASHGKPMFGSEKLRQIIKEELGERKVPTPPPLLAKPKPEAFDVNSIYNVDVAALLEEATKPRSLTEDFNADVNNFALDLMKGAHPETSKYKAAKTEFTDVQKQIADLELRIQSGQATWTPENTALMSALQKKKQELNGAVFGMNQLYGEQSFNALVGTPINRDGMVANLQKDVAEKSKVYQESLKKMDVAGANAALSQIKSANARLNNILYSSSEEGLTDGDKIYRYAFQQKFHDNEIYARSIFEPMLRNTSVLKELAISNKTNNRVQFSDKTATEEFKSTVNNYYLDALEQLKQQNPADADIFKSINPKEALRRYLYTSVIPDLKNTNPKSPRYEETLNKARNLWLYTKYDIEAKDAGKAFGGPIERAGDALVASTQDKDAYLSPIITEAGGRVLQGVGKFAEASGRGFAGAIEGMGKLTGVDTPWATSVKNEVGGLSQDDSELNKYYRSVQKELGVTPDVADNKEAAKANLEDKLIDNGAMMARFLMETEMMGTAFGTVGGLATKGAITYAPKTYAAVKTAVLGSKIALATRAGLSLKNAPLMSKAWLGTALAKTSAQGTIHGLQLAERAALFEATAYVFGEDREELGSGTAVAGYIGEQVFGRAVRMLGPLKRVASSYSSTALKGRAPIIADSFSEFTKQLVGRTGNALGQVVGETAEEIETIQTKKNISYKEAATMFLKQMVDSPEDAAIFLGMSAGMGMLGQHSMTSSLAFDSKQMTMWAMRAADSYVNDMKAWYKNDPAKLEAVIKSFDNAFNSASGAAQATGAIISMAAGVNTNVDDAWESSKMKAHAEKYIEVLKADGQWSQEAEDRVMERAKNKFEDVMHIGYNEKKDLPFTHLPMSELSRAAESSMDTVSIDSSNVKTEGDLKGFVQNITENIADIDQEGNVSLKGTTVNLEKSFREAKQMLTTMTQAVADLKKSGNLTDAEKIQLDERSKMLNEVADDIKTAEDLYSKQHDARKKSFRVNEVVMNAIVNARVNGTTADVELEKLSKIDPNKAENEIVADYKGEKGIFDTAKTTLKKIESGEAEGLNVFSEYVTGDKSIGEVANAVRLSSHKTGEIANVVSMFAGNSEKSKFLDLDAKESKILERLFPSEQTKADVESKINQLTQEKVPLEEEIKELNLDKQGRDPQTLSDAQKRVAESEAKVKEINNEIARLSRLLDSGKSETKDALNDRLKEQKKILKEREAELERISKEGAVDNRKTPKPITPEAIKRQQDKVDATKRNIKDLNDKIKNSKKNAKDSDNISKEIEAKREEAKKVRASVDADRKIIFNTKEVGKKIIDNKIEKLNKKLDKIKEEIRDVQDAILPVGPDEEMKLNEQLLSIRAKKQAILTNASNNVASQYKARNANAMNTVMQMTGIAPIMPATMTTMNGALSKDAEGFLKWVEESMDRRSMGIVDTMKSLLDPKILSNMFKLVEANKGVTRSAWNDKFGRNYINDALLIEDALHQLKLHGYDISDAMNFMEAHGLSKAFHNKTEIIAAKDQHIVQDLAKKLNVNEEEARVLLNNYMLSKSSLVSQERLFSEKYPDAAREMLKEMPDDAPDNYSANEKKLFEYKKGWLEAIINRDVTAMETYNGLIEGLEAIPNIEKKSQEARKELRDISEAYKTTGVDTEVAEEFLKDNAAIVDKLDEAYQSYKTEIIDQIQRIKLDHGVISIEDYNKVTASNDYYAPHFSVEQEADKLNEDRNRLYNKDVSKGQRYMEGRDRIEGQKLGFGDYRSPTMLLLKQYKTALLEGKKNMIAMSFKTLLDANPELQTGENGIKGFAKVYKPKQDQELGNDEFQFYVGGSEYRIKFHDSKMASSFIKTITNEDQVVATLLGPLAQRFRRAKTTMNIAFGFKGVKKDVGSAYAYLPRLGLDVGIVELTSEVAKTLGHLQGKSITGGKISNKELAKYEAEANEAGAFIAMADILSDSPSAPMASNYVKPTGAKSWEATKKVGKMATLASLAEASNANFEKATRLAVYILAKQKGKTNQQAAYIAREATMNFDKKGAQFRNKFVNTFALFMGINAYGNARAFNNMLHGETRSRQAAVAGAKLLEYAGFWAQLAWRASMLFVDEDEAEKYATDYMLNKLMEGERVKVPIIGVNDNSSAAYFSTEPGGALSAQLAKSIFGTALAYSTGNEDKLDLGKEMRMVFNAATEDYISAMPIKPRYSEGDTYLPSMEFDSPSSAFSPIWEIHKNEDAFGHDIYNEKSFENRKNFDNRKYRVARTSTPDAYIQLSKMLYNNGVNLYPEQIQYMMKSYTPNADLFNNTLKAIDVETLKEDMPDKYGEKKEYNNAAKKGKDTFTEILKGFTHTKNKDVASIYKAKYEAYKRVNIADFDREVYDKAIADFASALKEVEIAEQLDKGILIDKGEYTAERGRAIEKKYDIDREHINDMLKNIEKMHEEHRKGL